MRRFARLLLAAAVLAAAAGGGLMIWAKTQPKPGLVPEDTHWSQAVTDRDGRLLHLTLSEDGAYRLPVPRERCRARRLTRSCATRSAS